MRPEDVSAELVEKARKAAYAASPYQYSPHSNPMGDSGMAAALAAVLPEIQAQALNEAREALAGRVIWGEHRSGYSGALVRLDGVPDSPGTNGSIPLDHWFLHRAARLTEGNRP